MRATMGRPSLFVILALTVIGCRGGSDAGDAAAEADGSAGPKVDAITSATPGVASAILTASHKGWGNPDCFSCHTDPHRADYTVTACAACHASNGAPDRAASHPDGNCRGCHAATHATITFKDANDCRGCHRYAPGAAADECRFTEEYDVVVIGAGGGGLGAATALARAGKKVVVLEKHYRVGGSMGTFRRGDYTFEQSLHAMDGLDDNDDGTDATFKELGIWDVIKPRLVRGEYMYRTVFPDGLDLVIPADLAAYRALLTATFPAEADGINCLIDDILKLDENMKYLSSDPPQPEKVPQEVLDLFIEYMGIGTTQAVKKYLTDQRAIGVVTQLSGYAGTKPDDLVAMLFMLMWGSYHQHGFWYLTGGSQAVVNALEEAIVAAGGVIKTHSLVTKIDVENGVATVARTANGGCYRGTYFVSNANAPDTVLRLVGEAAWPADYVAKVKAMKMGQTGFQLVLGVDKDYADAFGGAHEIMAVNSYDINESFAKANAGDVDNIPLSIANYTILDPSTAPPGKSVIVICSGLPYDYKGEWRWSEGYDAYVALKNEVAWKLVKRAEQWLPGLSDHVEILDMSTPITVNRYTLNPGGSIFGWDNTVDQSFANRLPQQTPIDNLVLAGAWTFPAGGQAPVIISGASAAKIILKSPWGERSAWPRRRGDPPRTGGRTRSGPPAALGSGLPRDARNLSPQRGPHARGRARDVRRDAPRPGAG